MTGANAEEVGGALSPFRGRLLKGRPFPPPQALAERVDEAKRAGTFGGIRREMGPSPRAQGANETSYVVTCGGCAFEEEIPASHRASAIDRALKRGWRRQFVAGAPKSRFFCEACQNDRSHRERAYRRPGEDWETANARWAEGNPLRLPPGYAPAAGGGSSSAAGARAVEAATGTSGPGEESLLGVVNTLIRILSELQVAVSREGKGAPDPALSFALLLSVEQGREVGVEPPPIVLEYLKQGPDATL